MIDHAPSPERLRRVAEVLRGLDLPDDGGEAHRAGRRASVVAGDYLVPRLEEQEFDVSGVIAIAIVGPSGSGKSTIFNTLAGRPLTDAGPIRPTTRVPVAWAAHGLPLTLDGIRGRLDGEVAEGVRPPPDGVVLVDTPPPEVVDAEGTPVVDHVMAVVDAVVFVATGSRYADAESFGLLETAASRGLPTVMVLNRLPATPEMHRVIADDFASKLAGRRLLPRPDSELITTISESALTADDAALAPDAVAGVRKEIEALADPQSRPDVIASAVAGSLGRLRSDLATLRSWLIDRSVRHVELLDPMRANYRREARALLADVMGGVFGEIGSERRLEALASATARRAGRAARATAELWSDRAPDLVEGSPELFGHAESIIDVARERLQFWASELETLPGHIAGKRIGRRRRRRLAAALQDRVFDSEARIGRRTRRRIERIEGLDDAARHSLSDEVVGILETDGLRFRDRVAPTGTRGVLADLVMEGAGGD